jgi:PilZ domain
MHERRQSVRTYIFKPAQLMSAINHKVIGCTVRDISADGACLELDRPEEVTQVLDLSFDSFRSCRQCEVKWRSDSRIGVAFR